MAVKQMLLLPFGRQSSFSLMVEEWLLTTVQELYSPPGSYHSTEIYLSEKQAHCRQFGLITSSTAVLIVIKD